MAVRWSPGGCFERPRGMMPCASRRVLLADHGALAHGALAHGALAPGNSTRFARPQRQLGCASRLFLLALIQCTRYVRVLVLLYEYSGTLTSRTQSRAVACAGRVM